MPAITRSTYNGSSLFEPCEYCTDSSDEATAGNWDCIWFRRPIAHTLVALTMFGQKPDCLCNAFYGSPDICALCAHIDFNVARMILRGRVSEMEERRLRESMQEMQLRDASSNQRQHYEAEDEIDWGDNDESNDEWPANPNPTSVTTATATSSTQIQTIMVAVGDYELDLDTYNPETGGPSSPRWVIRNVPHNPPIPSDAPHRPEPVGPAAAPASTPAFNQPEIDPTSRWGQRPRAEIVVPRWEEGPASSAGEERYPVSNYETYLGEQEHEAEMGEMMEEMEWMEME